MVLKTLGGQIFPPCPPSSNVPDLGATINDPRTPVIK